MPIQNIQVLLITREDYAVYKQMSVTLTDDVLDAITRETQIHDVAPLLGERLFNDILKDPNPYADLLNGGEYIVDGVTYVNYGLKAVLVHYGYARYKMFGHVIDTPFGFIEKLEGAESKPEDYNTKKAIHKINMDSAFTIWGSVENYLIRKKIALFREGSCGMNPNRRSGGIKFQKISRRS